MSLFRRPDRILAGLLRERFILTTTSGQTWDGLLEDVDDNTVVLVDATVVNSGGERVKADGRVLLPRFDVAYMQRP